MAINKHLFTLAVGLPHDAHMVAGDYCEYDTTTSKMTVWPENEKKVTFYMDPSVYANMVTKGWLGANGATTPGGLTNFVDDDADAPAGSSVSLSAALPSGSNTIGNVNVNGTVPVSGTFWQATQPVSLASLPTLAAGTNLIGYVRPSDGTNFQPTMDVAARRGFVTHTDGTNSMPTGDAVARAIFHKVTDGTNTAAVKAASTAAVAADPAIVVALSPNNNTAALAWFEKITDGTNTSAVKAASTAAVATDPALVTTLSPNLPVPTMSLVNSAATTNATSIKASAGTVFSILLSNNSGSNPAYVKFFNKASAPTVGTDTPVMTIVVPINGTVSVPLGVIGIRFTTGIAMAITGAAADLDTTAVAAGQVKTMVSYI